MEQDRFQEQLKALPTKPGVYIFRDGEGKPLYVGKATSLRNRVRSYFGSPHTLVPKISKMVDTAQDLDFIVTDSEEEAIILECTLIKEHRPQFNVRLKDDKGYPYIKVSLNEEWPRVFSTRNFQDDGGRYFGPYSDAKAVKRTLKLLKRLFRYCSPKGIITGRNSRPCFDFYIGQCVGACSGDIPQQEYRDIIDQVILFLEGKDEDIIRDLKRKMADASQALQYEKAASIRDQIQAVELVSKSQKVVSTTKDNKDVIAFARERNEACVQVFFIRSGKVVGKEQFILEGTQDEEQSQVMATFIEQFYSAAANIPPQVLLQTEPQDIEMVNSWLRNVRGGVVSLEVPQRGQKKKIVDMVAENAAQALEQMRAKWLSDTGRTAAALQELEKSLDLPKLPRRMECYDISNIGGTSAVGSMVVFEDGRPKISNYRRFQIKTVDSIDDYAMMQEVLRRRFKRMGERDDSTWEAIPDLVLIDGGRGHLTAAQKVIQDMGINSITLASIAKENEEVFRPDKVKPIILPRDSQALYLIQRIRDEAHRFAISYHWKVRRKTISSSALDVSGIGPKRKRALMRQFGSVKAIKEASVDELASVSGMTRVLAEKLKQSL